MTRRICIGPTPFATKASAGEYLWPLSPGHDRQSSRSRRRLPAVSEVEASKTLRPELRFLHDQAPDVLDGDPDLANRISRGRHGHLSRRNSLMLLLPDLRLEQMHLLGQPTRLAHQRHQVGLDVPKLVRLPPAPHRKHDHRDCDQHTGRTSDNDKNVHPSHR